MNSFPANPQAGVVARTSRLRKNDYEFETSLGYIASLYLKKEGRRVLGGGSVGSACHASIRTWVQTPVPRGNLDMVVYISISTTEEGEDGQIPGAHWPTN